MVPTRPGGVDPEPRHLHGHSPSHQRSQSRRSELELRNHDTITFVDTEARAGESAFGVSAALLQHAQAFQL